MKYLILSTQQVNRFCPPRNTIFFYSRTFRHFLSVIKLKCLSLRRENNQLPHQFYLWNKCLGFFLTQILLYVQSLWNRRVVRMIFTVCVAKLIFVPCLERHPSSALGWEPRQLVGGGGSWQQHSLKALTLWCHKIIKMKTGGSLNSWERRNLNFQRH